MCGEISDEEDAPIPKVPVIDSQRPQFNKFDNIDAKVFNFNT